MKNTIIILVLAIIIGIGGYLFYRSSTDTLVAVGEPTPTTTPPVVTPPPVTQPTTTPKVASPVNKGETVIGTSVEGRSITAYHFGTGKKEILVIGGIHGGYSWNTVLVAYELMDALRATPTMIPPEVRVTVIPVLNPDGLFKVVGTAERFTKADAPTGVAVRTPGRFNANTVDVNRNFDCDWKKSGKWQDTTVNGGSAAFSEPESKALKAYVEAHPLTAAVVYYSAAGGVFSSQCGSGILPETSEINALYAKASGYPSYKNFDFYEVTGDAVNWLAKNKIPAISVLLTTHDQTEWTKNKAGIEALLNKYSK